MFEDPGLSWSQLKAFEACARHGSFAGAAERLRVTASAVRHQVSLLEARLGRRFFEREGGRLTLTPAGQRLAERVEPPLRALVDACVEARSGDADGALTLSAPPVFARRYLFGAEFLRWSAENDVQLEITDVKRDLHGAAPIAAVRLGAAPDPTLDRVKLTEVSLVLAAAPALAAGAEPTDASWWREQTLLTTGLGDSAWARLWAELGLEALEPPRRHVFTAYSVALEAAVEGRGLILAPRDLVRADVESGRLSILSDAEIADVARFHLLMRRDVAASPRGRALKRWLGRSIASG